MGVAAYRAEPTKRAFPTTLMFYLTVVVAMSSNELHSLEGRRPTGDAMDIFSGKDISLDSIVSPISSAAEGTNEAMDITDLTNPEDRPRDYPVWPPPSAAPVVDPAANAMVGALPQHVDWPGPLPSTHPSSNRAAPASSQTKR
jgi:hypothetical protein